MNGVPSPLILLKVYLCTLRCQINVPPIINFLTFCQPSGPYKDPRLLILRNMNIIRTPHIISFLVSTIHAKYSGKIEYFCIYFSSMLYDNLLLFPPLFYNHLKLFLKFRPPVYFDPPAIKLYNLFQPLVYQDPLRLFGTL